MTPSADHAIAETLALARSLLGERELSVSVIADRSNLVLRLDPHRTVARVAMATSLVRIGMTWLAREVELARFLSARAVNVTRPSLRVDPGPHERGGLIISFWELESTVGAGAPPSPHEAGAALGAIHSALASYPKDRLPEWGGYEEARQIMGRVTGGSVMTEREVHRLLRAFDRADAVVAGARSRSASFQAVHGDAHIGNVLATTDRGAVWTDFEDAFIGPIEYDLACLRSRADLFGEYREIIDAMTNAYDSPYDRELVDKLGLVRNVQVIPWLAVFAERHPELLPRMRARIERLPEIQ
ncbi:MAG TPA: phosphotransferase [Labilithrix sp.]|jgi:aminoglycoside phosphotransferase (APT) family kinase protein|nr:phosphotransferase [Labilithrix sp.]